MSMVVITCTLLKRTTVGVARHISACRHVLDTFGHRLVVPLISLWLAIREHVTGILMLFHRLVWSTLRFPWGSRGFHQPYGYDRWWHEIQFIPHVA